MSKPAPSPEFPRKIVVVGRRASKGDNGNAAYMARRRAEREQRRAMLRLLLRWGRGFSADDAPPDLRWPIATGGHETPHVVE